MNIAVAGVYVCVYVRARDRDGSEGAYARR
jgi:hypothetical protein